MIFTNKLYDVLKYVATIGLPAFITLWLAVGVIWQIPMTEPIGATLAALNVFLGALLGISNSNYKKEETNA